MYPARVRSAAASSAGMLSDARTPLPTSSSVPAMMRTMFLRNAVPSTWISTRGSQVCRATVQRYSVRTVVSRSQLAERNEAKSCVPTSRRAAAAMASQSRARCTWQQWGSRSGAGARWFQTL